MLTNISIKKAVIVRIKTYETNEHRDVDKQNLCLLSI